MEFSSSEATVRSYDNVHGLSMHADEVTPALVSAWPVLYHGLADVRIHATNDIPSKACDGANVFLWNMPLDVRKNARLHVLIIPLQSCASGPRTRPGPECWEPLEEFLAAWAGLRFV
mmetsp:Transcript_29906/g.81691  ORF Transcript_29906/g.81691 Transcript_29906/m.81691 type:complete len:117 (+) Transcript_29906:111-461(+)|eukprot:scaffold6442_cov35-Tisochrysis_lutea.AAC.1